MHSTTPLSMEEKPPNPPSQNRSINPNIAQESKRSSALQEDGLFFPNVSPDKDDISEGLQLAQGTEIQGLPDQASSPCQAGQQLSGQELDFTDAVREPSITLNNHYQHTKCTTAIPKV